MTRLRATLTTRPSDEPITVDELRQHGRIDDTTDDAWALLAIASARRRVEEETGRALMQQTWTAYMDQFPCGLIRLPRPRLISIAAVKYIDPDGEQQTLASSVYQVDGKSEPARFGLAHGQSWPATRCQMNAVEIAYPCGYGTSPDSVPEPIRQALLLIVGHLYEHREAVNDVQLHEIPMGAQWLLDPYRVVSFD